MLALGRNMARWIGVCLFLWCLGGVSASFAAPTQVPGVLPPLTSAAQQVSIPESILRGGVDYVFVEKSKRRLTLWRDGWLVRSYSIRLGRTPTGAKHQQGDGRTPEGLYTIDFRKPDSEFHLALHISYPSVHDQLVASEKGVNPGGAIMIHGLPNEADPAMATRIHRYVDWTEGCIAMTNAEIEEVWRLVPDGTPIEIVP